MTEKEEIQELCPELVQKEVLCPSPDSGGQEGPGDGVPTPGRRHRWLLQGQSGRAEREPAACGGPPAHLWAPALGPCCVQCTTGHLSVPEPDALGARSVPKCDNLRSPGMARCLLGVEGGPPWPA